MTKKEMELLNKMIDYYENNMNEIDFKYQKTEIDNLLKKYSDNHKVIYLKKLINNRIFRRINECSLFGTILTQDSYTKKERHLLAHYYIPFKNGDYEFERDCILSIYSKKNYYSHQDLIYRFANYYGVIIDKDRINDFFKDQKMRGKDSFEKYKNPYSNHEWKEDDKEIRQDFENLSTKPEDEKKAIIGDYAEIIMMKYEKERLKKMGREDLASRIIHVSRFLGDIYGYDILSFDGTKDKDGNDTVFLIEVKGYYDGSTDNIWLSKNEYRIFSSEELEDENSENYVYQLDFKKKMLFPIGEMDGNGIDVSGFIYKLDDSNDNVKLLVKQKTNS